jgi:hypothetical protein
MQAFGMANLAKASSPGSEERTDSDGSILPFPDCRADVLVVIPARNESADVGRVVTAIRELGLDVVVVDDDSSDHTAEVARAAGARLLCLPFHGGAWAAIQTGIRFALRRGYRYVITVDADGQHLPHEVRKLLNATREHPAANVLIGACPERANLRRRLAWRALRWLSGLAVEDLTSGFRVYDTDSMRLLVHVKHSLFEYQDVGVLLCLRRHGLTLREIPVSMQPRLHGHSRVFQSWPMVAYYLIYSALIGSSRRRRITPDSKQ